MAVRVLEVRNDETCIGCDGDAHVHVVLVDDGVAIDLGVHHRILLECHARGFHEKRHEGELHLMFLQDFFLHALAQRIHRRHVDFVERREVGC